MVDRNNEYCMIRRSRPPDYTWEIDGLTCDLFDRFLGIISSITVVTFLDMLKYHHKYKQLSKCHKCFNAENDVNARYCKICGTMLDQKAQEEDTHTASIL